MTLFSPITHSVQAPGGVRTARAGGIALPSFSELSAKDAGSESKRLPSQAGGPARLPRSIQTAHSRPLRNGETVACRGAGRSARGFFRDLPMERIATEIQAPGGIRVSSSPVCW